MSNDYNGKFLDGKKLIKKILKIDRFSYSENMGKLVLDHTGQAIFMNDVIRLIEKEMKDSV
jgi:hypothetical protein